MGKLYVPSKIRTAPDRVRHLLDEARTQISNVRGAGPEALRLLHAFDQIQQDLRHLEERNVDVRVERTDFEVLQRRLESRKRRFLREAARVLPQERARIDPRRSHWWWYLDETAARERRQSLLRLGAGAAAVLALLAVAWLAYKRFLAPPPEVGQAFQQMETGRARVMEGDLRAARAAFEAATELTPEDPEPWLWKGVVQHQLGETAAAQKALDTARRLYDARFDFILNRGRVYLQAGDLKQAQTDVETAIELDPNCGWGYYLRAGIAVRHGDSGAALADLDKAARLAEENGNARLQALASSQRAGVLNMLPKPTPTPQPES